ncbi:MAG TPA: hypothetical protein VGD50_03540 [Candidatus Baltobacteraceae bacterium]
MGLFAASGGAIVACTHTASLESADTNRPVTGVGYVSMDDLIKVHPLYAQLSHFDADIDALQLKAAGDVPQESSADIASQEQALQTQLNAASARTQKAIADEQNSYAQRESAAIAAILRQSAVAAPGEAAVAGQMAATSQQQAQDTKAQAGRNFDDYRAQTIAQGQAALGSIEHSLVQRADREYRARADQYAQHESSYSLDLASQDAGARLQLRTQLSNLALDDQGRADAKAQIDALDRKESDALGAMRNRDDADLTTYQGQLHAQVQSQIKTEAAQIQARTIAKLNERAGQTQTQVMNQVTTFQASAGGGLPVSALPPSVRAKLDALHRQFQAGFNKDAQQTIAAFNQTRDDLSKRFADLHGADAADQSSAHQAIEGLRKQRDDLYDQMVAQIDREVRVIAERRGVSVVFGHLVAPGEGIDLTPDALQDIESLHE